VGLYKPILVNERDLSATGKYELVCGEGRLLAHKELGEACIKAEIINLDEATAQLMTLGENIARTQVNSIEFARALKEMQGYGMSLEQLSAITGRREDQLRLYLQLMDQGEERLVKGVEDGVFPIAFALNVARSNDRSVQHLLMDAFDNGVVNCENLARVRRIIEDRLQKGRNLGGRKVEVPYTVDKLKGDIQQITREKESFVYEAHQKENRLFRILLSLRRLQEDARFAEMLQADGLAESPKLKGEYAL
jgi:ParB family chromosome partitioning protein